MKVTHITPAAFGELGLFGGGERYPYELAKAMSSHCDTELVVFGTTADEYSDGRLTVRMIKTRAKWQGFEVNPLNERLPLIIRNTDVVHLHQWESIVTNLAVLTASVFRKRSFATDCGGHGINYWRQTRLDKLLTGFLPLSNFGAQLYPELASKASVILGGVNLDYFHPSGSPLPDQVLFVGRLLRHKAIDVLIKALPNDVHLVVAGRPYDVQYRRELEELASGKNVSFFYDASDHDLLELYRSSTVLVHPAVYEAASGHSWKNPELLGLVLLEAMACGTPVICTAVGGMPELVADGVNGYVVPPNDASALRDSISRVLDCQVRERLSRGALETAGRSSWDVVAHRCLAAYESKR